MARMTGRPVDLLGTSSGLHDRLFVCQADAFFRSGDRHYSDVYIQIGEHTQRGDDGLPWSEEDTRQYGRDLKALIRFVSQYADHVILCSCFYDVVVKGKLNGYLYKLGMERLSLFLKRCRGEVYNQEVDAVTEAKNEEIRRIADETGTDFCGINEYMMGLAEHFRTRYVHGDHVHYEDRAKSVIVQQYMMFLNPHE